MTLFLIAQGRRENPHEHMRRSGMRSRDRLHALQLLMAKVNFDMGWWRLRLGEPVQFFAGPFGPATLRRDSPWYFHDLHGTGSELR